MGIIHAKGLIDQSNISKHFKLKEFKISDSYPNLIKNHSFTELQLYKILTLTKILEPIREEFQIPIRINSAFRTPELNKKVSGSLRSQHLLCEACDFNFFNEYKNKIVLSQVYSFILDNLDSNYLKIILYYNKNNHTQFIHVSIPSLDGIHIRKILVNNYDKNGKRYFENYL